VWNGVLESSTQQQQQQQQQGLQGKGAQPPRGAGMLSARRLHGSYSSSGALGGLGLAVLGGSMGMGVIPAHSSSLVRSSSGGKGGAGSGSLSWSPETKPFGVTGGTGRVTSTSPRRPPTAAAGLSMLSGLGGNSTGTQQIQSYGVLRVAQPLLHQQQQHLMGAFGVTGSVTSSTPAYAAGPRLSPRAKSAPIRGHYSRGCDPALQVTAAGATGVLLVPPVMHGGVALHVQSGSSSSRGRGSVRPVVPLLNLAGVV
jgi:hypothetical protein